MNIKLNSEDLNSIYYKMTMISEKRLQQVYTLPLQNGSGTVERIPLRNGIELLWFDVTPEESFSLNCHVHYPHLEIFYPLSGSGFWENERNSYEMSTNTSNLLFVQNQKVYAEFSAKEKITQMELRFDLRLLEHLYVEKKQLFNKQFFCKQITGCPRIRVMMEQMKNCPYTGALKKLYLEGIALELLALHLHRVEQEEIMKRAAVRLSLTDIEALQQAKEVLDHSFLSPPSLLALAKMVGLNDYKLKHGFKELFGTTVFGYVRGLRMYEARQLLEQGNKNVTETAMLVGYHNLSHFASRFRKTFGYNPSEVLKRDFAFPHELLTK